MRIPPADSRRSARSVLIVDASLSGRTMSSRDEPLSSWRAASREPGGAPAPASPGVSRLRRHDYAWVASAQVKSALLLAGLYGRARPWREPHPTRDTPNASFAALGWAHPFEPGWLASRWPNLAPSLFRVPAYFPRVVLHRRRLVDSRFRSRAASRGTITRPAAARAELMGARSPCSTHAARRRTCRRPHVLHAPLRGSTCRPNSCRPWIDEFRFFIAARAAREPAVTERRTCA